MIVSYKISPSPAMLRSLDISLIPNWYRTPFIQTTALGFVFFWVFTAYTTIQFYAASTYGPTLAANSVSAIYISFTVACLFAPGVTNKLGCRLTMFFGILGYAALILSSLVYFLCGDRVEYIVVIGGAVLGCGAALLWTAQGRLILQYAAVAEILSKDTSFYLEEGNTRRSSKSQTGTIMGVFWAVFQCSSLVGGAISFFYYNTKPTGSTFLYVIFLVFMLLGAISTQVLLPPGMLYSGTARKYKSGLEEGTFTDQNAKENVNNLVTEKSRLVKEREWTSLTAESIHDDVSEEPWTVEASRTLSLFCTKPMIVLSMLFFYTGFNQPYQQATFGNRFFTKRTIGIELVVFHLMEIVGAICCGRALDGDDSSNKKYFASQQATNDSRRSAAMSCLLIFIAVNMTGNILAYIQEHGSSDGGGVVALDISNVHAIRPSMAFACWGFADAQIQVYVYWLLGTIYSSGDDHARAVGFYKCVQSLGTSLGFYLIPTSRLGATTQLYLSFAVFAVGTSLSWFQLPNEK